MPERPVPADGSDRQDTADGGYFDSLTPAVYLRLTTFKPDGVPVSCTVHSVADGGRVYFRAGTRSGAVDRLRHTSAVQVARCGVLGFCTYGPPLDAVARQLPESEASVVAAELDRKHRAWRRFATWLLRSRAVYYQLAAYDLVRGQDGPPGRLAPLRIEVRVTRVSVASDATTSLAALCPPARKPRSGRRDNMRIVTVTMAPHEGPPHDAPATADMPRLDRMRSCLSARPRPPAIRKHAGARASRRGAGHDIAQLSVSG
jgi:PPOX class probable F420-dependent enzyme